MIQYRASQFSSQLLTPDVFAILPTVPVVNNQGEGELRYVLYGSVFWSQTFAPAHEAE